MSAERLAGRGIPRSSWRISGMHLFQDSKLLLVHNISTFHSKEMAYAEAKLDADKKEQI